MAQNEKAGMSETRSRTVAGGVTCRHVNSFQVLTKAETLQRCCQRPRRPATGQRRKESLEEEELLTPFSLIMNSALVLEICLHLKTNFFKGLSLVPDIFSQCHLSFGLDGFWIFDHDWSRLSHTAMTIMEKNPAAAISRSVCDTQNESQQQHVKGNY